MIHHYLKDVATLELNPDKCIGCKMCVKVCPHVVLKMDNKKARIIDKDRCMECGACMRNCPTDAITVRAGVGCAAALLGSLDKPEQASCECGDKGCC